MTTRFALAGAEIFDGRHFVNDHAVIVADGRIEAVVPSAALPEDVERRAVSGLLAPGFIDVQVNGGGGVLFNDDRSAEGIRTIGAAHRTFGTTGFLPTFITDTRARMAEAVAAGHAARVAQVPGCLGIHIEGPFLNPERKGIHDPKLIRPIEDADLAILADAPVDRTLVTLAPEMVPAAAIERLARAGVRIAAGHTKADPATLERARAAGLTGYTHLFNAMPPFAGREPGPVGAALAERESWCGLIVDMHHVDAVSLKAALAARGTERMMLVTDAMSATGSPLTEFTLLGRTIFRRDGKLVAADGTLAGSDLDMASAVRNTVRELGLPLGPALNMASLAPAGFLGLDGELGRIAPGYRASLVLLDDELEVKATWIDGA